MSDNLPPLRHTGKVAHAGHAPPKFRSPINSGLSIRRPLPSPPRNKDSSHGLSNSQALNFTAHLHSFEHHIPLKHDVKYVYSEIPSSPNNVYFFEYRGFGVPSPTLGALGDVYVDQNEKCSSLYAKCRANWVRWTVPGWLEHPFLTDTVLWI